MNVETGVVGDNAVPRPESSIKDLLPDPRNIWAVIRRNLALFLIVFALVVTGVILWTSRQTPTYSAKSSLLVQPRGEIVVDVKSVTPDVPASADLVDTRVLLVQSPLLARRVAAAYDRRHPAASPRNSAQMDSLAAELLGMITAARSGATYIIDITASSQEAEQAAEVANLFAQEFVASDKDAKVSANTNADTWLRQRSAELAREATAADAALQQYKIRNGLLSANGRSGAENQISNLDSGIAQAEADLAEKQGRLAAARRQVGSSRVDLQACKLEYSIVSPK